MRRRYWVIIVAIPLLLLAAEAVYWRTVAEQLRTGFHDWVADRVAEGWNVESGSPSIGGWPRTATLTVPNMTLRHAGPMLPGEVNVASAGVTLAVSLLDPGILHVSLTGPTHVRAGDLPDIIVTGDETSVSAPLQQTDVLSVVVRARGLRLESASGAWHVTIGLLTANATIPDAAPADRSPAAAIFAMSSEAIALPASIRWPLGPNISSLSLDGRLRGPLPGIHGIRHSAEAWRDGGGSLEISHLAMGWGPLGLTSSATLALDDQLQPMGSGNARVVGYAETLDRLAANGVLTKSAATAAKAVLSLMAGTSDADQPSSVDVPLTLRYRTLSLHQIPLLRLPEVDWPAR